MPAAMPLRSAAACRGPAEPTGKSGLPLRQDHGEFLRQFLLNIRDRHGAIYAQESIGRLLHSLEIGIANTGKEFSVFALEPVRGFDASDPAPAHLRAYIEQHGKIGL